VRIVLKRFDRRSDLIVACSAVVIAVASSCFVLTNHLSARSSAIGYAGLFLATLAGSATIFVPSPNVLVIALHAHALNTALTALLAGLGSGLGELTGYLAGRAGQLEVLHPSPTFLRYWRRWRFLTVLVLASFPDPVFDAVGILAGSIRMPVATFTLATVLGRLLYSGAIAVAVVLFSSRF
jgi:membrane protein YqaA with SNARE-associated domain